MEGFIALLVLLAYLTKKNNDQLPKGKVLS